MRRRAVGLAAAVVLLLAACSTPLPAPQPDAVPAATPPALTAEQAEDVLAEVSTALAEADAALSADALAPRVTGPAATIRSVEYALATAAGTPEALTAIPSGAQTLVLPTTDSWPRTVMVITEAPEDLQAPLLLTLVQAEPRAQYQLWSWVRLFPGVETPATAQPEVGSAPVPADAADLAAAPTDVLAQYVDVLTNRDASPHAAVFTADPLSAGIAQTRDAFAGLVGAMGSLTETYQVDESGVQALRTADGGAIVVGTVRTVTTITLVDSTLTIADQTAALLGTTTVASSLAITWLSVVAFAVPPAGSDEPIVVLGAEHSRIQVTGS
jgi:hypothetical protein